MILPKGKDKINIIELTRVQLVAWLTERDIASYRADQILKWIYLRQADSFDLMTNLSKDIRGLLAQHFVIGRLAIIIRFVCQARWAAPRGVCFA